jgi:hypothetical protein
MAVRNSNPTLSRPSDGSISTPTPRDAATAAKATKYVRQSNSLAASAVLTVLRGIGSPDMSSPAMT